MALEVKLVRCEPNDPRRCQAKGDGNEGQCVFTSTEGSTYCPKHSSGLEAKRQDRRAANMYRLQVWQQRVEEFAANEQITSLAGEIGILRLILEEIIVQCKTQTDLIMFSSRISDLVMKVDKIVNTFDKIENKNGNLLDKSAALVLAGKIVDIIGEHIDDPVKIDKISNDIIDLVARLAGKDVSNDD